MELKINIDLEAALGEALSAEKLGPILQKHLTEAITSAVLDATGYRSEFRKKLTEQVAAALPHGLNLDDVVKFQHVLNKTVLEVVRCANQDAVTLALEKAVKQVMPEVPPVVKMSDLIKDAREDFHKEPTDAFFAYFEPSEYGGGWLYLDENEKPGDSYGRSDRDSNKYRARYRLAFNKEGCVYALHLDGKDVTPSSRPDTIGSFDATLMAMYVGRSSLEVDMDPDDVESAASEQWED